MAAVHNCFVGWIEDVAQSMCFRPPTLPSHLQDDMGTALRPLNLLGDRGFRARINEPFGQKCRPSWPLAKRHKASKVTHWPGSPHPPSIASHSATRLLLVTFLAITPALCSWPNHIDTRRIRSSRHVCLFWPQTGGWVRHITVCQMKPDARVALHLAHRAT